MSRTLGRIAAGLTVAAAASLSLTTVASAAAPAAHAHVAKAAHSTHRTGFKPMGCEERRECY